MQGMSGTQMEEHNERMTSGRREVYPRDDGPSLFLAADLDTDTNVFVNDFDVPEHALREKYLQKK